MVLEGSETSEVVTACERIVIHWKAEGCTTYWVPQTF